MLNGRAAVVTGSTSGIGLGIAEVLAGKGANLVLNGFGDREAIERTRADLAARHGVEVAYSDADVSKPEEVEAMVAACVARFGTIDILVNNAGIQHVADAGEFPVDRWNAVIAINLSGVFWGMQAALPHMRRQGFGRIVNIGSVHGLVGSKQKAAYVAAKHGVVGMGKVVALETAGSGITCNTICPGWVHTPLVQQQIEARAAREGLSIEAATEALLGEKQPSRQFVSPEQIGELAAFLASDAAAQMTGAAIPIDGGWTAQ